MNTTFHTVSTLRRQLEVSAASWATERHTDHARSALLVVALRVHFLRDALVQFSTTDDFEAFIAADAVLDTIASIAPAIKAAYDLGDVTELALPERQAETQAIVDGLRATVSDLIRTATATVRRSCALAA